MADDEANDAPQEDAPEGEGDEGEGADGEESAGGRSSMVSDGMTVEKRDDPIGNLFEDVRLKIESQNDEINELKRQLQLVEGRFPPTEESRDQADDIKTRLENCFEKLNVLYKDARVIQDKDPERAWPVLAFATTLEEDADKSSGLDYGVVTSHIEPLSFPPDEHSFCPTTQTESQESLFNRPRKRAQRPCAPPKAAGKGDCDRHRLQEELANRDKAVECLHKKVLKMQAELARLCREKQQQRFDSNSLNEGCNDSVLNTGAGDNCDVFDMLSKGAPKIQKDMTNGEKDGTSPTQQNGDYRKKYCELLEEYAKKDCKIQKLQSQLRTVLSQTGENVKDPITDVLRKQLEECREENDSQRVIMCEQAEQIEDYHEKYLEVLQKNEELKCIAKRMQFDNRKMQDQINFEMQQIKNKFEAKLAEFAEYPKLLENEQVKLADMTSEKQELERKLRVVCVEFKKLRKEQEARDNPEEGGTCTQCCFEKEKLKDVLDQLDALRKCYTAMTEKLECTKLELDNLRKDSAKVICRLKARAEEQRAKLKSHINCLENNLAKARAAVSITCADKETTIKDMQGQLNCLSICLDSSQKQIKTLKDHIAYLNDGKAKPVVICCPTSEKN